MEHLTASNVLDGQTLTIVKMDVFVHFYRSQSYILDI